MQKRLTAFLRRHRRQLLLSVAVLVVATCAAALLAARGTARAAPRGPDTPPLRSDVPAGTVVRWNGLVHATAMLSHGAVSAFSPQTVFATVSVGAKEIVRSERAATTFVLVVDKSGSMNGEKIERAKEAAIGFVNGMEASDEVVLVAYDSAPMLLLGRGRAEERRSTAVAAIRSLSAGGGTHIGTALRLALGTVEGASSDRIRRIVLVSDGIDESGRPPDEIVAVASEAAHRGIAVSTIGIGADYNESLMTRLADASHGNYHFLRESGELGRILAAEYGQMGATVARDVQVQVELPEGVTFVRATGASAVVRDSWVVASLGSLFGGDERRIVLELRTHPEAAGPMGELRTRVRYEDRAARRQVALAWKGIPLLATADSGAVRRMTNPVALEEGIEVTAVARHDEAKLAWEQGDLEGSNRIAEDNLRTLRLSNASLQSEAIAGQIAEYERHVGAFNALSPGSEGGRLHARGVTVSNRARAARDQGSQ